MGSAFTSEFLNKIIVYWVKFPVGNCHFSEVAFLVFCGFGGILWPFVVWFGGPNFSRAVSKSLMGLGVWGCFAPGFLWGLCSCYGVFKCVFIRVNGFVFLS